MRLLATDELHLIGGGASIDHILTKGALGGMFIGTVTGFAVGFATDGLGLGMMGAMLGLSGGPLLGLLASAPYAVIYGEEAHYIVIEANSQNTKNPEKSL